MIRLHDSIAPTKGNAHDEFRAGEAAAILRPNYSETPFKSSRNLLDSHPERRDEW